MRYTPEEVEVIRKNYRGRGPAWVAAKLGRSYNSVVAKANQLGLFCDDPPTRGAIAVCDLAHRYDVHPATVKKYLTRLGLSWRSSGRGWACRAWVTASTAEALRPHLERLSALPRSEDMAAAGYVSEKRLPQLLDIPRSLLPTARSRQKRGRVSSFAADLMAVLKPRRCRHGYYWYHPRDVDAARAVVDRWRGRGQKLLTAKQYALEHGISRANALKRLHRMGARCVVRGGRFMLAVDPAQAHHSPEVTP